MTNRLFVALEIPYDIRKEIIDYRDRLYPESAAVRWEPVEKMHITLKFLGDVEINLQDRIINILESLASKSKKIECSFEKFGLFYKGKVPGILWAGLKENRELENLALLIDDSLAELNFEKEKRKFKSHITLLRLKGKEDRNKIQKFLEFDFPELRFTADSFTLFKSKLLPAGSVYSTLKSFNLI